MKKLSKEERLKIEIGKGELNLKIHNSNWNHSINYWERLFILEISSILVLFVTHLNFGYDFLIPLILLMFNFSILTTIYLTSARKKFLKGYRLEKDELIRKYDVLLSD